MGASTARTAARFDVQADRLWPDRANLLLLRGVVPLMARSFRFLSSIVKGFNFLIKLSQEKNVIVSWWIKTWTSIFNQPLPPGNWLIRTSLPTFQATLNGPGHPIIMQEVWALAVPSWRYSRIMASPRILCDAWSYIIKSWLMKIDCVDEWFH